MFDVVGGEGHQAFAFRPSSLLRFLYGPKYKLCHRHEAGISQDEAKSEILRTRPPRGMRGEERVMSALTIVTKCIHASVEWHWLEQMS